MIIIEPIPDGFGNCNSCGTTKDVCRIAAGVPTDRGVPRNLSAINLCPQCQAKLLGKLAKMKEDK